jgi:hypothetical protein
MRVHIGDYPGWFGPYQLADAIGAVFRLGEDRTTALSEWLDRDRNWIGNALKWYHGRWNKRLVRVHIHTYDAFSADHTLALVILPVLQKLRSYSQSYGSVSVWM